MGTLRVGVIEPHPTTNNKVRLTFSEAVIVGDAQTIGNYSVSGGVTVTAAAVVVGSPVAQSQVDLTLTGLANGTTYTVTVINVRDQASSTAIISPNEKGSFIWREYGDTNLNGVVEQGGMVQHQDKGYYGDQLLGYNVLGTKDVTPPIITNVTPTNLSNINPLTVISFDVTDSESPFRRIIIKLFYADGSWDMVWDGDNFGPKFTNGSNVHVTIYQGHRFSIRRDGGWVVGNSVHLTPYAIDTGGNENI